MTSLIDEKYDAGTSAADFLAADDPPDGEDAGPVEETGEAPYGWTTDRATGEARPKKRPGRPRTPPPADELRAAPPIERAPDRPPGPRSRRAGKAALPGTADPDMPKGGVIAAGVNKLYRRAGKIVRAFDADLGEAFIACTKRDPGSDDADELTVGEAWENLCKTNPRIRRWVLTAIASGAVGDLIMAHAPIGIAFMMKPWVQRFIHMERLIESMAAADDDDTPEGEGELPGGMTAADVGEMRDLAMEQARRMAQRMGRTLTDEQLTEAAAAMGSSGVPPAFQRRAQPRRMSRAQRNGARG